MGEQGTYRGVFPVAAEVSGARVYVGVHLASVGRRVVCVGLDVRTVNLPDSVLDAPADLGNRTWLEVGSSVLRNLPLSGVIDEAMEKYRSYIDVVSKGGAVDWPAGHEVDVPSPTTRRRRGPRPVLGEDVLRAVVAPAYLMGGRRPVQAVLHALQQSGALGSRVTIDQARKAVARARTLGLIPPPRRTRKTSDTTEKTGENNETSTQTTSEVDQR
jgi:hypothetical protein